MRKPISILLAVAVVFVSLACGTISADAATIKGDVNGDNNITLRDATLAQKINVGSLKPTAFQSYSADFDGNGTATLTDAFLIQKFVCLDKETLNEYSPNRAERIKFLDAVNTERASKGLSTISYNDATLEAGNIRAAEYQLNGSHTRPDKTSYETVFPECNLTSSKLNIREMYADNSVKGAKFFSNIKANESSLYDELMLPNITTICVGCIPDSSSSDRGYWIILTN